MIRVPRPSLQWLRYLVATILLAITGTLLFGSLHALLIEPIWRRLIGGLPFAILAAAGMTWCHTELVSLRAIPAGIGGGALFGASLWLALLPMTSVGAALRISGGRATLGAFEPAVELVVAAATGGLIGFSVSRSLRVTLACATCITTVVLAMAGPIAITVGSTQRRLLLGFLPLYVAAGAVLSLAVRLRWAQNPPHPLRRAA